VVEAVDLTTLVVEELEDIEHLFQAEQNYNYNQDQLLLQLVDLEQVVVQMLEVHQEQDQLLDIYLQMVVVVVVMPVEEYKTDLMEDLVVVLQMMEPLSLHHQVMLDQLTLFKEMMVVKVDNLQVIMELVEVVELVLLEQMVVVLQVNQEMVVQEPQI
jgi:hypothetical protein